MKVVVAMSGGVDSSVAAALLKEQGYEVIGITMQLQPSNRLAEEVDRFGGCCGLDAMTDAKKIARTLDIPHYVVNFRDVFARQVIADFCREYSLGRTPNPCIRCNQYIKFDALLKRAQELGAGTIATGHYARIEKENNSRRYLLRKSIDRRKDQTYVLYTMTQEQLHHSLFPVGDLTKEEVRHIAEQLGLPVSGKAESQEICFIPDNNYPEFLKEYTGITPRPGPIIDREGNVLGEHRGIVSYTIGQRKGLGIASREPLYVTAVNAEANTITVGGKDEVYATGIIASGLNWISIEKLDSPITVKAKIRYLNREAEAIITPTGTGEVIVRFQEPQMAPAPGQAVVFYDGDIVVGGGLIARVDSSKGMNK
jgi:tRNA-specific 2-thiouridylase